MKYFYWFYRWRRRWRNPPAVVISHSGQATPRPQVHVSVAGIHGSQGVYTWNATHQGEACATMYGKGLAQIMERRLIDERVNVGAYAGCYAPDESTVNEQPL